MHVLSACTLNAYQKEVQKGFFVPYRVHCVGAGVEVKDRFGSTTMSCREKRPPRIMSPLFSSTGRDREPGITLQCWL